VQLNVLRLGWNPRASTPRVVGSMFKQREADMKDAQAAETASPLPPPPADGSMPGALPPTAAAGDISAVAIPDAATAAAPDAASLLAPAVEAAAPAPAIVKPPSKPQQY
jgi:hypothetical protein